MKNISPMFETFVEQSDLDDSKITEIDSLINEFQETEYKKAINKLNKSGNIFDLDESKCGLNDKSEIHSQFKNYDHSLDIDRAESSGVKRNVGKPSSHEDETERPVERNGRIELESTLTIGELLDRT